MANKPTIPRAIANEYSSTLASSITDTATTITVTSGTGLNANGGYVILDEGVSGKEEVVYVESVSGTTLTVATNGRGSEGTTAVAHDSGATITDILVADHINGARTAVIAEHSDAGAHTAISSTLALSGSTINSSNKILDVSATNVLSAVALSSSNKVVDFSSLLDGWIPANETWTYASATTISVPSGAASRYTVGDRIKFTQSAAVKYSNVVAVADTLLTITGGISYVLANEAITLNSFSHAQSPVGFPTWFQWSPTFTGFSVNPTTHSARFQVNGRSCTLKYINGDLGTSNLTTFTISAPITASSTGISAAPTSVNIDNSSFITTPGRVEIQNSTNIVTAYSNVGTGTWTASNGKGISFVMTYGI